MRRIVLLIVIAVVSYGAWRHHRASEDVSTLITELRPHLLLRYERLSALPWQALTLHDVTLEPVGSWRDGLQLPVGYRVNAAELRWQRPDRVTGRTLVHLVGLQVPVGGWPAPVAAVLQRAAITRIGGNLQVELTPPLGQEPWQASAEWQTDQGLTLSAVASAHGGPQFPALDATETVLLSAWLGVQEQGLLARLQQNEALAARRSVGAWVDKTRSELAQRSEQREWPLPTATLDTVETLLLQPRSFTLTLAPPAPARLDQLSLYAPADRWALLGLALEAP